jgi:DNA-binding response OmpR family regulator
VEVAVVEVAVVEVPEVEEVEVEAVEVGELVVGATAVGLVPAGEEVAVGLVEVGGDGLVPASTASVVTSAATSAVSGRSVTLELAAPTTQKAKVVVNAVATTHNPISATLFTSSMMAGCGTNNLKVGSRNPQEAGYPGPVASIVIVEDDSHIRRLAADALARAGHSVETAGSALDGLKLAVGGKPDLVVLDLGLPDLDGTELLRMLRAVSQVPVIVATAREGDQAVVGALDAGADDYLVKPYSVAQLEARVRAVLRRRQTDQTRLTIEVGGLLLDPGSREARLDGERMVLSPKEFDLLLLLAENVGEVVSKREMLAQVWRQPYGGGDRTVDVHLSSLRSKLGETARRPRYLHTVHGVGVKLVAPQ